MTNLRALNDAGNPCIELIKSLTALSDIALPMREANILFWAKNLSRVFRARWLEAMRLAGLHCQETLSDDWVVHCKKVGRGEQALLYLGRYPYRGVLPEKNIIMEQKLPAKSEEELRQKIDALISLLRSVREEDRCRREEIQQKLSALLLSMKSEREETQQKLSLLLSSMKSERENEGQRMASAISRMQSQLRLNGLGLTKVDPPAQGGKIEG